MVLLFVLSFLVVLSDSAVTKLDDFVRVKREISSQLEEPGVKREFEQTQSLYVKNYYGRNSDSSRLDAIESIKNEVDTSDLDEILSFLDEHEDLAATIGFNSNCSYLNLSSAKCEQDCKIYLNLLQLYELYDQNETSKLLDYMELYSYSGGPLSAYDNGNYDMCRYAYGTYCYVPAIASGLTIYQRGCCIPGNCTGDDAEKVVKQTTLCYELFAETYGLIISAAGGEYETYCEAIPRHFDSGAIIVILIFFLFLFLVCSTSIYKQLVEFEKLDAIWRGENVKRMESAADALSLSGGDSGNSSDEKLKKKRNEMINTFVATFCIQDSWKNFISARKNKDLNFLDGIRWWSMCWVVLGHAFFFNLMMGLTNEQTVFPVDGINPARTDFRYDINDFYTVFALQGFFSVDSFFWLSGFLGLWSLVKMVKKFERVSGGWTMLFPLSYLVRFLRLGPMMIYVTLVSWKLSDQFPEGPHVISRDVNSAACEENWTKVFFFYANLSDNEDAESCMGQLWYVQCDMQMFLFLPMFALLYHVYPKTGMLSCFAAFLLCCGIRLYEGYYYHFAENLVVPGITAIHGGNEGTDSYFKPWTRMGTYWAGALGMMVFLSTYPRFQLTKGQYWIVSSTAAFILCALTFWPYGDVVDAPGERWNLDQNVWYYALSRPGWGVGLSLMAFAMRFGSPKDPQAAKKESQDEKYILIGRDLMYADASPSNGAYDEINDEYQRGRVAPAERWNNYMLSKYLLSFEVYQPLAKLTYLMYLVHLNIYTWYTYDLQTSVTYTSWEVIYLFIGTLSCAFVVSVVLWFVMERPLSNMVTLLLKFLLGGGKGKEHKQAQQAGPKQKRNQGMSEMSNEYGANSKYVAQMGGNSGREQQVGLLDEGAYRVGADAVPAPAAYSAYAMPGHGTFEQSEQSTSLTGAEHTQQRATQGLIGIKRDMHGDVSLGTAAKDVSLRSRTGNEEI